MNSRQARRLARNQRARDGRLSRKVSGHFLQHTGDHSVGYLTAREAMLISQDSRPVQKQRSQGNYGIVTYDPVIG